MRLLIESNANEVMEEINKLLSDRKINPYKYQPSHTRILSGEEEGAFAWITVNYLNGFFTGGKVLLFFVFFVFCSFVFLLMYYLKDN